MPLSLTKFNSSNIYKSAILYILYYSVAKLAKTSLGLRFQFWWNAFAGDLRGRATERARFCYIHFILFLLIKMNWYTTTWGSKARIIHRNYSSLPGLSRRALPRDSHSRLPRKLYFPPFSEVPFRIPFEVSSDWTKREKLAKFCTRAMGTGLLTRCGFWDK